MNETEKLAYLAGLLDGEGHFYTPLAVNGQGDKHLEFRMVIINTDKKMIDWISENYGGYVWEGKAKIINHKNCFRWQLAGQKAKELTLKVLPYLITKQSQALAALTVYEGRKNKRK